ncbi:MAG: hypothetical protein R3F59_21875 [Myxococcota bacterium]
MRVDRRILVQCPVTEEWLRPSCAVRPPGDDRLLHPNAVIRCAVSHVPVAVDRAVKDELSSAASWLSPAEAGRCELSGNVTARRMLVRADCCGRRVARSSTGASAMSGKVWCRDHARRCALHAGRVLPREAATCAITGRDLCIEHVVTTECGRTVGVDQVLALPDGRAGCVEHFVQCAADGHVTPRSSVATCGLCNGEVCTDHRGTDPYDPRRELCASHLKPCQHCGLTTQHEKSAPMCVWCSDVRREPLGKFLAVFDGRVRPHLTAFQRMTGSVLVSGSDEVQVYDVRTLLSVQRFRVTGGQVATLAYGEWVALR